MVGQYCIKGIAALRPSNQVTFNSTRDHDDREPYPSPVSPLHTLSFEIRPDTDRKYPVIIEFQTPRPIARFFSGESVKECMYFLCHVLDASMVLC